MSELKDAPKTEKVKLLKPHEHNGVPYVAGDEIDVNAHEKSLLIEWEVIAGKSGGKAKE